MIVHSRRQTRKRKGPGRPPKYGRRPVRMPRELPRRPERCDTAHRRLLAVTRALLDSRAGVTVEELMRATSLSRRQTYRYLRLVSEFWPLAARVDRTRGSAGALLIRPWSPAPGGWRPWPCRRGEEAA